MFASIRDIVGGRSGSYEEVLRMAKDTALKEMEAQAAQMGANANEKTYSGDYLMKVGINAFTTNQAFSRVIELTAE